MKNKIKKRVGLQFIELKQIEKKAGMAEPRAHGRKALLLKIRSHPSFIGEDSVGCRLESGHAEGTLPPNLWRPRADPLIHCWVFIGPGTRDLLLRSRDWAKK